MLLQTLTPFYVLCAGILGAHLPASEVAIEDVMEDIESGLKFFNEDYSSINVDGLFGLRLGQGNHFLYQLVQINLKILMSLLKLKI